MQVQQGMQQLQSTMPGMFGSADQTGFLGGGFGAGLGAGLGGGLPTPPSQPAQPPEELYATQLQQLQDMGFFDAEANVRALQMTVCCRATDDHLSQ